MIRGVLQVPRLVCVYAPNLPIQVERLYHGQTASILVPQPATGETVFAASDDVLARGVKIGMSLYQARQMVPEAMVVEPKENEYHARHEAVLNAVRVFAQAVETVAWGEFFFHARGLERIHGSETQLVSDVRATAQEASHLKVNVSLANGKFVARQTALRYKAHVVPDNEEAEFIASFPITDLPNLPGDIHRQLVLLDIHTLGNLAALSKAAVLRHFGAKAALWYELARGNDSRFLQPDLPPLRMAKSVTLNEPVADRQVVLNIVSHLSRRLSRSLHNRGYQAEAIKVILEVGNTTPVLLEKGQALKPPTADEGAISRLAQQILGRLGVSLPVARVSLSAYPLRTWQLDGEQLGLMKVGVPERKARRESAIQLLIHRFGEGIIFLASLLGSPIPIKLKVTLNPEGYPSMVVLAGQPHLVYAIDEIWREEKSWWDKPIRRDYFRLILADFSLRNIFHNLDNDEWYLDRAWPIL